MSLAARREYQNTTVRLPRHIYERAKTVIGRSQIASFNEFVVQAIEEKVRKSTEAEIDAAFAQMADDPDYQSSSIALTQEFARSDWEALTAGDTQKVPKYERPKTRTSKTRPR